MTQKREDPDGAAPALLEVRDVDFSYGPLQVLFGVGLTVPEGGRVALLGTNGAGKSSVLRVISGLGRPRRGSVWFDGRDITHLSPERRVGLGLIQLPGGKATFPSLTVLENLRVGAYQFLSDRARVESRLEQVFELFPQLAARRSQPAGSLSGGEQQMMALGRCLIAGPKLLMVDELSLGLAPVVLESILRTLDAIVSQGTTLLLVEQSLNIALEIAGHAYFLEKGEVRFSGPTAELLDRGDLVRSIFFGQEAATP